MFENLVDISKIEVHPDTLKQINSWTMGPGDAAFLQNCMEYFKPKKIVECGCGMSTMLFGRWANANLSDVVSIENHQESIDKTVETLKCSWIERVKIHKVELGEVHYHGREFKNYLSRPETDRIDFLFIDGPLGCFGREASLYLFEDKIDNNTKIFLHDFGRPGEQEAVKNWMEYTLRGWSSIEFHSNDDFPSRLGVKMLFKDNEL